MGSRHYDNPHCEGEKEFQDRILKDLNISKDFLENIMKTIF